MILTAIPKLPYISKQPTIDYYVTQLGCSLQSDYGDYLILKLGHAELHFFSFPDLQPGRSDFMIYLRIDHGIEDLYRSLHEKQVEIHPNGKLENKPWKQKEFSLLDPNGTLLTFGEASEYS